jgi:ADP-ribose diphosphatase
MKEIEKKILQKGLLFDFVRGRYEDGFVVTREFIETKFSASVVFPLTNDNKVILVKQFRAPTGGDILEVPAGKVDRGEEPIDAAKRELEEETGMIAGKIVSLGRGFASPGISSEFYHFFLATELTQGTPNPDYDEKVSAIIMDISEFEKKIQSGEIPDSKSIAAYGLWRASQK